VQQPPPNGDAASASGGGPESAPQAKSLGPLPPVDALPPPDPLPPLDPNSARPGGESPGLPPESVSSLGRRKLDPAVPPQAKTNSTLKPVTAARHLLSMCWSKQNAC
jgi:hypothetical protein